MYWDAANVGQNDIINENKAIADAQNIATNNRIEQTNSVVEQNNVDSIARDTQLQSNIDATNTKLTSEVARLDEVNATQDEAIAATNVRIDNIDTTITQNNTLINNRIDNEISRLDGVNTVQDSAIATNTTKIEALDNNAVKYNADKSMVTLGGSNGTTITNLKAGVADSDAVNVAQLNAVDSKVNTNTAQIVATNNRIDTTNTTVASNDQASKDRDANLQATIDTNKALANQQNTTTNARIDDTNARIDDTNSELTKQVTRLDNTNTTQDATIVTNKALADKQNVDTNKRIDDTNVIVTGHTQQITEIAKTSATYVKDIARIDETDKKQNAILDSHTASINNLDYRINGLEKDMSAGIAGAYAMSSMSTAPLGKRGVAFGSGYYNGESAVSIGYTQTVDTKYDKIVSIKANGSFDTSNNFGVGVGATYFF